MLNIEFIALWQLAQLHTDCPPPTPGAKRKTAHKTPGATVRPRPWPRTARTNNVQSEAARAPPWPKHHSTPFVEGKGW